MDASTKLAAKLVAEEIDKHGVTWETVRFLALQTVRAYRSKPEREREETMRDHLLWYVADHVAVRVVRKLQERLPNDLYTAETQLSKEYKGIMCNLDAFIRCSTADITKALEGRLIKVVSTKWKRDMILYEMTRLFDEEELPIMLVWFAKLEKEVFNEDT